MVELIFSKYEPVNDIYLLETDTPKVPKDDLETTETGLIIGRKSIVESRKILGRIVKKGPNCSDDYKIGDVINFYPEAGLDIVFKDKDNKYLLMGDEKFLGIVHE